MHSVSIVELIFMQDSIFNLARRCATRANIIPHSWLIRKNIPGFLWRPVNRCWRSIDMLLSLTQVILRNDRPLILKKVYNLILAYAYYLPTIRPRNSSEHFGTCPAVTTW